ncbi:MAG: alpha/beta fold hydrolase [Nanoarchaeota archaeon]
MPDFNRIEAEFKKLKTIINDTVLFFRTSVNGMYSKNKRFPAGAINSIKKFQQSKKTSLNKIAQFAKENPQLGKFENEILVIINRINFEDNNIQMFSNPNSTVEQVTSTLLNYEKLILQDQKNITDAAYLLEMYRYMKFFDVNEFFIKDVTIGSAPCTLYQHKSVASPQKGIITVCGFGEARQYYKGMAMVLAKQGYKVASMDVPSQGSNATADIQYSLGLAAEWLQNIVRSFRASGIQKIGVIGHSYGAFTCLFAAGGYSLTAERDTYIYYDRYKKTAAEMVSYYGKLQKYTRDFTQPELNNILQNAEKFDRELESAYSGLIRTLETSIQRQQTTGAARIDAVISLSAPQSAQRARRDVEWLLKVMKNKFTPKKLVQIITGFANNMTISRDRSMFPGRGFGMKMKSEIRIPKVPLSKNAIHIAGPTVVFDKKTFAEYMLKMKDPNDYFTLMNYFSKTDKVLGRPPSELISTFVRNHLQKIPKLFIYGTIDPLLQDLGKDEIEGVYLMCANAEKKRGNTEIKRYEDRGHGLIKGTDNSNEWATPVATSGDTINDIVSFFNKHL